jgi:hypothetical protein
MRPKATSVCGLKLPNEQVPPKSELWLLNAYVSIRTYADVCSSTQVPAKSELWLLNSVPVERRAELLLDKGNKEVPNATSVCGLKLLVYAALSY